MRALGPTIGAEVDGVDLAAPLDDELQAELHRALLEWKVLFFRDQDITREQHRAFAARWGELEQHPFYRYVHPGEPDVDVVRLAKDAEAGGVENEWHADVTWHTHPSFGAVLRAVEVPELGGDTLWADAGAAYDGLPVDVRRRIDGLTAVHDWRTTFGLAMPRGRARGAVARVPAGRAPRRAASTPRPAGAPSSSTRSSPSTSSAWPGTRPTPCSTSSTGR